MVFMDNAATSYIKPAAVWRAVREAMRDCASVGRGGYPQSEAAAARVYSCREAVCRLFGYGRPERVIFTYNATVALNMAIKGLIGEGHAVISGYEHNAVLRPLESLSRYGVSYTAAESPLFDGGGMLEAIRAAIRADTRLVVVNHVSNVFGQIAPVEEIDALCYERGLPLIIDASQSAGVVAPELSRLRAAQFLCMPGHKGLYGPQGTGVMLHIGELDCATLIEGGTGSESASTRQPSFDPDRFESGTQNVAGIAGLEAGIRFVLSRGQEAILRHERALAGYMAEGLQAAGARVYTAPEPAGQTGVLSFTLEGRQSADVAAALSAAGIAVRAGLHCAPLAHRSAGTFPDGTVRLSPGVFSSERDAERVVRAVAALAV